MRNGQIGNLSKFEAVILAAGQGTRLRPLTQTLPKPLIPINGTPILFSALAALARFGVTRTTVVLGHLGDSIRRAVGDQFGTMPIRYVTSDAYHTTNSAYSLTLALHDVGTDVLVLDGDIVFEADVLPRVTATDGSAILAVSPFMSDMTGAAATVDDGGIVRSLAVYRPDLVTGGLPDGLLKTLGIQLFRATFVTDHLRPALYRATRDGETMLHHEQVVARLLTTPSATVRAVPCDDCRWLEIDDHDDLAAATDLFDGPELQSWVVNALSKPYQQQAAYG